MASMTASTSDPFASASASVYDPRSFLLPPTRPRQLSEDDDGDDEMDRDHNTRRAAASSPSSPHSPASRYAVILLNQPVPSRQRALFRSIWTHATVRICADGGADRLRDLVQTETDRGGGNEWSLPDAIVGDLDSITESTRDSFAKQGVEIAHRPSQYATDLQKSIQWVEDWERAVQPNVGISSSTQLDLVIVGGLSGRLDQTAHTLHVLWKLCPPLPSQGGYEDPEAAEQGSTRGGNVIKRHRAWVVAESSLAVLLPPGQHTLRLPSPPLGKCCGNLPFGVDGGNTAAAAKVRTQGLEWDLDPQQPQSLGGYLSTSNHVVYPSGASGTAEVVIETDKPIYWSVEI